MAQITLRSLAELGTYFGVEASTNTTEHSADREGDGTVPAAADERADSDRAPADLGMLLRRLAEAGAALATLTREDQEARAAAVSLLERYERLTEEQHQAQDSLAQARQVRADAKTLVEGAFTDSGRAAAAEVLAMAEQAERAADVLVAERQAAAATVAAEPTLARLLGERRRDEERRAAEAAAAARARQLAEDIAVVERTMAAGDLDGAGAQLAPLVRDHPDSAEVAAVQQSYRRRVQAVKAAMAEEALRCARRAYRQAPAEAISRLEVLELGGLSEHVLQQITGLWTAACARLCRQRGNEEPRLRYLPNPGVGVIVAREASDLPYVVVSALGAHFQPGTPVDERFVQRARPLKATGR